MFLVVIFWIKVIYTLLFSSNIILDVSCDPNLDEIVLFYFHPILDVSCRQFLDDKFMLLFSFHIGCSKSG